MGRLVGKVVLPRINHDHAWPAQFIWCGLDVDRTVFRDGEEESPVVGRLRARVAWLIVGVCMGHEVNASDRRAEVGECKLTFPPVVAESVGFERHGWCWGRLAGEPAQYTDRTSMGSGTRI